MIGCLDCERLERQLAACERKLRAQALEWERVLAENEELRTRAGKRKDASAKRGRPRGRK